MSVDISRSGARRSQPEEFRIGGIEPFSTVDYPDGIAAVIFAQGCPLRCFYCHNPDLLPASAAAPFHWSDIERLLDVRRGLLDAVVFSGGEPLAQAALLPAMARVKERGLKVGLHTSGVLPARFAKALALADWVGFDVKTGFAAYEAVTDVKSSGAHVEASLRLLIASGVAHEVRTTVSARHHSPASIRALSETLHAYGIRNFALQEERSTEKCKADHPTLLVDATLLHSLSARFDRFDFRLR